MENKNKFCILWLWGMFLFVPFLVAQDENDTQDTISEKTENINKEDTSDTKNQEDDPGSEATDQSTTTSEDTSDVKNQENDSTENNNDTNSEATNDDEKSSEVTNDDSTENNNDNNSEATDQSTTTNEDNSDIKNQETTTSEDASDVKNQENDSTENNNETNSEATNDDGNSSEAANDDSTKNNETNSEATNDDGNSSEAANDDSTENNNDENNDSVNEEAAEKIKKEIIEKIKSLPFTISSIDELSALISEIEISSDIELAAVTLLVQIDELDKKLILQILQMSKSKNKDTSVIAINHITKIIREYITTDEKNENFTDEDFIEVFSAYRHESFTSTMLFWYSKTNEGTRNLILQCFVKMGAPGLLDIVQFLRLNPSEELKTLAVNVTYSLGDTAAIPNIIALLGDVNPFIQNYANEALGKFGKKVLPVLIEYIQKEKNEEHVAVAISIIGDMGEDAKETIPLLIKYLKKKDATQLAATRALKNMGKDAYVALQDLISNLKASDWQVRQSSAEIIGNFGEKSVSAITPLMNQYSREDNGIVRASICRQFGRIGKPALKAVDILIEALQDYDETVVKSAAESLGELAVDDRKVIDSLIEILSFFNLNARTAAAKALGNIGKSSRNVVKTMNTMLQTNTDPGVREGVAMALGYMGDSLVSMGSDGKRSINLLTSALKYDRAEIVKVAAADALGKIGDSYAISALIDAVRNDLIVVREVASRSLVKIGNSSVVEIIRALGSSRDEESRIAFVSILSELGKDAIPAVIRLNGYLDSWKGKEREALVKTLGKIGINNRTEETIAKLAQILHYGGDKTVNPMIADTLKQFGNISIPHVIPLLKNDDEKVVNIAKNVIEHLFADASLLLKQIVEKNDDEVLTSRALEILSKDKNTLPIILNALKYESVLVQDTAKNVIVENMGKTSIQPLVNIIESSHLSLERQLAGEILSRLGKEAVPSLMDIIAKSENEKARLVAIDSIYSIGSKAEKAIPVIKEAIKQRKDMEQSRLAKCLGKIGPKAIPAILELLQSNNNSVQNCAIEALGETGAKDSISYLLKSLENERLLPMVIKAAVKMSDISLPTLMNSLDNENHHIRFACAAALFEIASAKAIASLAQRILVETNPMVKYMLQIALDKCQEKLEKGS